ncbi:hypothetical protein HZA57_02750 [Candidatus Poribacteria bacterium]|nr:hypothetical protein [Candidatus Poribacteria bacterium]
MQRALPCLAALLLAGAVAVQGAEGSDSEPVSSDTEAPGADGAVRFSNAPELRAAEDKDGHAIVITMEDLAPEEHESAKRVVAEMNALAKSLRQRVNSEGLDSPDYARDWLRRERTVNELRGHRLWEEVIAPSLDAQPEAPSAEGLKRLAELDERERQAAEEHAREQARQAAERRREAREKEAEAARERAREAAGERTERRKQIDLFNQQTGFRHDRTIRWCLEHGIDPLSRLGARNVKPALEGKTP